MTDLTEFLLARIAEDEAKARECAKVYPSPWYVQDRGWMACVKADAPNFHEVTRLEQGQVERGTVEWLSYAVEHVGNWDPARVLAECEAKRRIVELHRSEPGYFHHGASTGSVAAWDSVPPDADIADGQPACTTCGEFSEYGVPWPCPTLRLLALPYADHPDYREEWRP